MKSNYKILIVDDDKNFRNSLAIGLQKENFVVSKMPEQNGIDLIKAIKKEFPEVKLVLVTAYASEQLEKKCNELQIDGYFTKPFRISLLIEKLNEF